MKLLNYNDAGKFCTHQENTLSFNSRWSDIYDSN